MADISLQPHQETQLIPSTTKKAVYSVPAEFSAERTMLSFPFFFLDNSTEISIGSKQKGSYFNVLAHQKFPVPRHFARKVHRNIEQIISKHPHPLVNPVPICTLYKLRQQMKLSKKGGQVLSLVKDAIKGIQSTVIDARLSTGAEITTSVYSTVYFKGQRLPSGGTAQMLYIEFADWYLNYLNSNSVRQIQTKFYNKLTDDEQRFYEHIGAKFYGIHYVLEENGEKTLHHKTPYLQFKYSTICEQFPLIRKAYLSKDVRLPKIHDAMVKNGFLEKVTTKKLPKDETGKADWLFKYFAGSVMRAEILKYMSPKKPASRKLTPIDKEEFEVKALVMDMGEQLAEPKNPHWEFIAKHVDSGQIYRYLSEVKEEHRDGIADNRAAIFNVKVKRDYPHLYPNS